MPSETGSSGGVDQEGSLEGAIRNALNKAYPGGDQGVDAMIEKYQEGTIKNLISEFRILRKVTKNLPNEKYKKQISDTIREYVKSKPVIDKRTKKIKAPAMSAQDLYEQTTFNVQAGEDIMKLSVKLYDLLYKFDISETKDQKNLRESLKRLKRVIEEILSV